MKLRFKLKTKRPKLQLKSKKYKGEEGSYFLNQTDTEFIHSGAAILDCVLGGGWALGRIANLVGDKCLSGETIISAQRGVKPRKMTLQTLFDRVHGNHWNRNEDIETFL